MSAYDKVQIKINLAWESINRGHKSLANEFLESAARLMDEQKSYKRTSKKGQLQAAQWDAALDETLAL